MNCPVRFSVRPFLSLIHPALLPLGVFSAVMALCLISGSLILRQVRERLYGEPAPPSATVVMIQPNFDARKYVIEDNIRKLRALTDEAFGNLSEKPDLIAWPEGEFEVDIRYWTEEGRKDTYWGRVVKELFDYQERLGTWLMTGTLDHEMVAGRDGNMKRINYNSSVLIDPEGNISDFYHKIRLVPFSEYFPWDKEKFSGLYEFFRTYDISDWGVGENRVVFRHEKMGISTPICFEGVFSDHMRRFVLKGADVIADGAGEIRPGALDHYVPGYLNEGAFLQSAAPMRL